MTFLRRMICGKLIKGAKDGSIRIINPKKETHSRDNLVVVTVVSHSPPFICAARLCKLQLRVDNYCFDAACADVPYCCFPESKSLTTAQAWWAHSTMPVRTVWQQTGAV